MPLGIRSLLPRCPRRGPDPRSARQVPYNEDRCAWECSDGYYRYGQACFPCSASACGVGQYRAGCSSARDSACVACTNGPSSSTYTGAGSPAGANNCAYQCSPGYFSVNGSCQECSRSACDVGMYRSPCTAQEDGKCTPCTNGPLSGDLHAP